MAASLEKLQNIDKFDLDRFLQKEMNFDTIELRVSESGASTVKVTHPSGDAVLVGHWNGARWLDVVSTGVATTSATMYSPVRDLMYERAEALAEMQRAQIRRLEDALIRERMAGEAGSRDALVSTVFSLYKEELLSMSDVMGRTGWNQWEFREYLSEHPEHRQVDILGFLAGYVEE